MKPLPTVSTLAALLVLSACNPGTAQGGTGSLSPATTAARRPESAGCSGPGKTVSPGMTPVTPAGLRVYGGFAIETIAQVPHARELAALPDGDLIVGTGSSDVYIVPDAEAAGAAGAPQVFAQLPDGGAAGVAFAQDRCTLLFGTTNGVWSTPYGSGDLAAQKVAEIAKVRTGPEAPGTDGDVHVSTSVAYWKGIVYVSVGSSCNAYEDRGTKPCTEVDPTRAAISQMHLDGSNFTQRAHKMRNGIAIAIDPATGALWAGGAGQDALPFGHPYEYLDDVSAHAGNPSYGWPQCEEDHVVYWPGSNCASQTVPRVELPAYSTIIGDVFYPLAPSGPYAFPARFRGDLFAAAHGSWHQRHGIYAAKPRVVFVPMHGDAPVKPVDWSDPTTQWQTFVGGFQPEGLTRIGRPTGIAVGAKGSLFVADDVNGVIYRVRPIASPATTQRR